MRMRRQVQQDILAQIGREIDQLRPRQGEMERKRFCLDLEWERFQTADASKFDRLSQRTSRPQGALGNSQVERIAQRARATNVIRLEIGNGAFFLALEMQALRVNLPEMNFHWRRLSEFIA